MHTEVGGLSSSPGTAYVCIRESDATAGDGTISSLLLPSICCWHKLSRLYCLLVPRIGPYRSSWADLHPQLQRSFMSFSLVVGFVPSVGTWGRLAVLELRSSMDTLLETAQIDTQWLWPHWLHLPFFWCHKSTHGFSHAHTPGWDWIIQGTGRDPWLLFRVHSVRSPLSSRRWCWCMS